MPGTRKKDGPPIELTDKVWAFLMDDWGPGHVAEMKKPERAASREHHFGGAELDPVRHAHAKAGECVLAKTFGQSLSVLNWKRGRGDGGIDMTLDRDTFDAKTTITASSRLLMVHYKDAHRLDELADKLVLVQLDVARRTGWCRGYLTKAKFIQLHRLAGAGHPLLITGTPFVELEWLDDISELIEAHRVKYFDEVPNDS